MSSSDVYRGWPDMNQEPSSDPSIATLLCQSGSFPKGWQGDLPSHEATEIVGSIKAHLLSERHWRVMSKYPAASRNSSDSILFHVRSSVVEEETQTPKVEV